MLNNKQQRSLVRKLGFKIYRLLFIAKLMAWVYSRLNMEVYWVLKQTEGYLIVNIESQGKLNKIAKMRNNKKLRVRDLDNGCIFRTPKRTWGKLKIVSQIVILVFLFSCQKETESTCWTCTEVWSGYINGSNTKEVCDVLEATKLNGKRYVKYVTLENNTKGVTLYKTTCTK